MRTGLYLLLLGCSLILQPASAGDQLVIPGHVASTDQQVIPKPNINMDKILGEFSEPNKRFGPVSEPPITK